MVAARCSIDRDRGVDVSIISSLSRDMFTLEICLWFVPVEASHLNVKRLGLTRPTIRHEALASLYAVWYCDSVAEDVHGQRCSL